MSGDGHLLQLGAYSTIPILPAEILIDQLDLWSEHDIGQRLPVYSAALIQGVFPTAAGVERVGRGGADGAGDGRHHGGNGAGAGDLVEQVQRGRPQREPADAAVRDGPGRVGALLRCAGAGG